MELKMGWTKVAEKDSELNARLLYEENLKECYRELCKDKAPGADGETW